MGYEIKNNMSAGDTVYFADCGSHAETRGLCESCYNAGFLAGQRGDEPTEADKRNRSWIAGYTAGVQARGHH